MTSFYLGYSKKSITSTSSSVISSVYNSSDEFQDAERAWDPTDHLVHVVTRRVGEKSDLREKGDPRDKCDPNTPPKDVTLDGATLKMPRDSSSKVPQDAVPKDTLSPPSSRGFERIKKPEKISLPTTFMAHGLPTCDDLDKEFDFSVKPAQKNLPKAPLDFLVQRPPSPPYTHVSVPQNSPLSGCGTPSSHGVVKAHNPVNLDEMLEATFANHDSEEDMAAFLDDDDDYPASDEEEGSEDEKDTFYVDADTIKAAHESVLDLKALLEDNFTLVPGESVESLEKRALRMVHLEESFSVQDSFEPRTLLADQDRAFIPWKPVIEDLEVYFDMRYPDLQKGSSRYEFHRARLVRNRTRLRILAQYVAGLEDKSRNLCRLSRSF